MFFKVEYPLNSEGYWNYNDFLDLIDFDTAFLFRGLICDFLYEV